jgi:hypothetical protein
MTVTFKEACEFIAEVHLERTGVQLDPEKDVFEMSPTGELWPVIEAYEAAKAWRAAQEPAP